MQRARRKNSGLTLIEVLVVIGILTMIIGLGLLVSFDSYKGYLFRSERSVIVGVLERARSRAINNMYQKSWGVCYDSTGKQYIIFQVPKAGACAADSDDHAIPASPNATISFTPSDRVVFTQLSGQVSAEETVTITEDSRTSTITINNEGTIIW